MVVRFSGGIGAHLAKGSHSRDRQDVLEARLAGVIARCYNHRCPPRREIYRHTMALPPWL